MSAPSSGSAGGSPTPGYYPDPSIPGYIRYWNGSSWVPGTSRPAPADGEPMPAPPAGAAAEPAPAAPSTGQPSTAEETGPVFFDEEGDSGQVDGEDPEGAALATRDRGEVDVPSAATTWDDPQRLHGTSPDGGASWQADASRQAGFGGEQDQLVSWGAVPPQREGAAPGAPGEAQPWGDAPREDAAAAAQEGSGQEASGQQASGQARPRQGAAADVPKDGTMAIRAMGSGTPPVADGTMAIRIDRGGDRPGRDRPAPAAGPAAAQSPAAPQQSAPARTGYGYPQQSGPSVPGQGGYGYPQQADRQGGYGYPQPGPAAPQQSGYGYPQQAPATPQQGGPGGYGYPGPSASPASPAPQQGGAPEGVIPWKPPVDNPFAASQTQGRPAPLGRRFAARLIDTVVLCALLAGVVVPLWSAAADHIGDKVEAAKQSGVQTTVYLLDGTTSGYLAIVIAALLVVGLLVEALPTAKWGHTLGKKVCGVQVLDIEGHETPGFGAAAKRWLVYGLLGALVIGVVNALWCLIDRPWRQCWHDKAARTFVAEG
ncbi:RDD family protein [Streptomyces sp. NPDC053542]|uniref:RDD family protein n=1 Tax=Streptomyces sp. NPDC053542 TaxID=3365710 RepID=UPI0037CFB608